MVSGIAASRAKPNDMNLVRLLLEGLVGKMGSAVQAIKFCICLCIVTTLIVCPLPNVSAQEQHSDSQANNQAVNALVRDVVHNEIEAQLRDDSLWCYRERRQEDGKPNKMLEACQTKEGELERLLAVDGRELDSAQRQAEDEHIQKLTSHPEHLRAKQKKEREDGEQARNLLRVFPQAFLFQCENEAGNLITLRFRPNPRFRPTTHASQVFHHMEGTLVLDTQQKRLVEINGRLTSEVKFGGGLFGHLDRNGTFVVKQSEVADGHWDLVFMSVHMSGRALFFKTIAVSQEQTLFDYKPLPRGATLQQAADFLRKDGDIHTVSLGVLGR
jgi:hypothetical protein